MRYPEEMAECPNKPQHLGVEKIRGDVKDHFVQIEPTPTNKMTTTFNHHHCLRPTRIAAIILITAASLVAVASATAAFYYFGTAHVYLNDKRLLVNSGSSRVEQETHVDSSDNYVRYSIIPEDVRKPRIEVLVDTNMALQMYKISKGNSASCFLTPIIFPPSSVHPSTPPSNHSTINLTEIDRQTTLQISSKPIPDPRILGERGMKFCDTDRIYWSIPMAQAPLNHHRNSVTDTQNLPHEAETKPRNHTLNPNLNPTINHNLNPTINHLQPPEPAPHVNRRVKRQTMIYVCFWDWTSCYYFTFKDDRTNFKYYRCDVKCEYVDYRRYYNY